MMTQLERKSNTPDGWPKRLLARRDKNVAAVAPAKKNARIAWALLAHERSFHPEYIPAHAVVQ